jgi:4-hydroxy-3-polyprenylbenzoate decarboxylase
MQNTMPLDPSLKQTKPPFSVTKIGFDCTIGPDAIQADYEACVVTEPVALPQSVPNLSEAQLTEEMSDFIREVPRTWQQVLERFAGQPYPLVYRTFGQLRPKLGRMANASPNFPYTFSQTGDFVEGTE